MQIEVDDTLMWTHEMILISFSRDKWVIYLQSALMPYTVHSSGCPPWTEEDTGGKDIFRAVCSKFYPASQIHFVRHQLQQNITKAKCLTWLWRQWCGMFCASGFFAWPLSWPFTCFHGNIHGLYFSAGIAYSRCFTCCC